MINSVVLTGRLTKEPELKKTANGTSCCSFSLAVNRNFKKDGQQEADFISCQAWNKTAENLCAYQHKGSLIGLRGRIQTRNYDNQQGQKVYVTEVVAEEISFLDSKSSQRTNGYQNQEYAQTGYQNSYQGGYQDPYANSYQNQGWEPNQELHPDDLPW